MPNKVVSLKKFSFEDLIDSKAKTFAARSGRKIVRSIFCNNNEKCFVDEQKDVKTGYSQYTHYVYGW